MKLTSAPLHNLSPADPSNVLSGDYKPLMAEAGIERKGGLQTEALRDGLDRALLRSPALGGPSLTWPAQNHSSLSVVV